MTIRSYRPGSILGISKILYFRRHTQTYSNIFPAISMRLECDNDHSFASNIDNKLGGAVLQLLHLRLLFLEKISCVTLPKHCFIAWPCYVSFLKSQTIILMCMCLRIFRPRSKTFIETFHNFDYSLPIKRKVKLRKIKCVVRNSL